jgi:hypothetical protein
VRKWRLILGTSLLLVFVGAIVGVRGAGSGSTAKVSAHGVPAFVNSSLEATRGDRQPFGTSAHKARSSIPGTGMLLYQGVSPAARDLPLAVVPQVPRPKARPIENENPARGQSVLVHDPVVQTQVGDAPMPDPSPNFDGIADGFGSSANGGFSSCGCLPPDTNGEVGPTQYVQIPNTDFSIFDKTGTKLAGPTAINNLWSAAGGLCAQPGISDTLVVYDQLANRWLLTTLEAAALGATSNGECIAVSTSSDATGTYYLYAFDFGNTLMDYPKIGVWPDSYFMTANEFPGNAQLSVGVGVFAFERNRMIQGLPARYVFYDEGAPCPAPSPTGPIVPTCGYQLLAGQLPADLDGSRLPPTPSSPSDSSDVVVPPGTPGVIVAVDDPVSLPVLGTPNPPGAPGFHLRIWKFNVDWSQTPPASTFGVGANHDADFLVPVAMFTRASLNTCVFGETAPNCVPQFDGVAGPSPQGLDVLGDRLMFRAAYRNYGSNPPVGIPANTQSLVLNLSVEVADPNAPNNTRIGIRWMEVRNPSGISGSPTIFQESTYSLADTAQHLLWRWMGSIAQDASGNTALGFSASGPQDFPTVRYVGRLVGDPLNSLPQTEKTSPQPATGATPYGGPQTEPEGRWGDYSDLTVDPVDDCTFWYTQEYLEANLFGDWRTRIVAFKFPSCQKPTAVDVTRFGAHWTKAGVGVSWRTGTETEIAGFNVWRSSGRSWRRVNKALVPAKHVGGTVGVGYRLLDRSVRRGTFYTYRLQVVNLKGKRSWYGVGSVPTR